MKKARLGVNPNRAELRGAVKSLKESGPVVYLMRRDVRANDNWSLLFLQEKARPVRVAHILEKVHPLYRHAWFYAKGLEECQADLKALNIPLDIVASTEKLSKYFDDVKPAGLVADLNTLRQFDLSPVIKLCDDADIPLWEVDSHNVVPVWVASDKQEYAARTIRPKINKQLSDWLHDIPPTSSNSEKLESVQTFDVKKFLDDNWKESEEPVGLKFIPGSLAAKEALSKFIKKASQFEKYRNDPNKDALSNMSPWLRHGHISKQRVALEVRKDTNSSASFIEELIVRGELAENFTYYNKNYDNLEGAPNFGKKTLEDHAADKREYVYTYEQLAESETHDQLWNAAQRQLVNHGKMHGFMRMYWAKKVLEWSESPEKALENGVKLNDTFAMDGRDPRGYVGVMWSITGLHDQGWKERPIFGKVRYMNYEGCKRKFDIEEYITKHSAKVKK